jgi:alanine-alpha-ketoisovalerate/valine-pyruvate aminotransferase
MVTGAVSSDEHSVDGRVENRISLQNMNTVKGSQSGSLFFYLGVLFSGQRSPDYFRKKQHMIPVRPKNHRNPMKRMMERAAVA